jgi:DNA-binding GntR family transcriptional regulator
VKLAIEARDPERARAAMAQIIEDVMALIARSSS